MKIKLSLLIITLFLLSINTYSQEDAFFEDKPSHFKNSAFIGALGNVESLLSINYERFFYFSKNDWIKYYFRTGFGFNENEYGGSHNYKLAFELNSLIGKRRHFLDAGLGYTPVLNMRESQSYHTKNINKGYFYYFYTIRMGYRFHVTDNSYFGISYLLTYRPDSAFNSNLIPVSSFGFRFGMYF